MESTLQKAKGGAPATELYNAGSGSCPCPERLVAIELVENEIRRFLSSEEPEVICVSGHWGVGKTFAWMKYLKDAQARGEIALKRYSYVSLFGVNSLDDLKYAVFENSVDTPDTDLTPTLETLQSNWIYAAAAGVRRLALLAKQTPILNNYVGGIMPMWFAAIRQTIICVDDFERRGKGLSVRDVLGLVNNLKELKKCKVCLILNDEALEEDQEDFQKYLEKVVDTKLKFTPSAKECALIALAEVNETSKLLSEFCIKLGISNIRVIKKIERLIGQVEPIVAKFRQHLWRQTVHSLTLLGWSVYEPAKAPSRDYLKKKNSIDFLRIDKKEPIPEKEAAWNALLGVYEFGSMDEFDLALLDGIENGFFDQKRVEKAASELNNKIQAGNLGASFQAAWETYHDSFDDNQEEVLNLMYKTFVEALQYITPMNMSSTITLFKELGRKEQASEMLKRYIEAHDSEPQIFDLGNHPFSDRVSDPDVIQMFKSKYATFKSKLEPKEVLLRIADNHSWSPEDIASLSALPVKGYYEMLKNSRGHDLRKIISASLLFDTIVNAATNYKEISTRAKAALKQIGQESALNARRVRAYGVQIDDPASNNSDDTPLG